MRLLIVGTLEGHITTAGKIALDNGASVAHVETVDAALTALRSGQGADLIMIDVRLDVANLCTSLTSERISVPVVGCGIGADTKLAVDAIRAGAKEYIPLPPDAELIAAVLQAVAEEATSIIHRDPAMKTVLRLADQIAPANASVMITGESGTGKEVLARYLHSRSKRATKQFISLNCAAIPEALLESELFGHEKGAFTGADKRRIGHFEQADGGTLFLDEVGEIPLDQQGKLLRALQEHQFERVGDDKTIEADVRIIAATNRDLEVEVQEGRFREDLYYRLSVFPLTVPPLRERREDIVPLAHHFVELICREQGRALLGIGQRASRTLQAHDWPGNIRELRNVIERAVIMSKSERLRLDLAMGESQPTAIATDVSLSAETHLYTDAEMREREKANLLLALRQSNWRISGDGGAAELLGLKPSTLAYRMQGFGIEKPR